MDSLTLWIMQMDIPWLTPVAAALDRDIVMLAVTLLLVLLGEQRKGKIAKIAVAAALAVILSLAIKEMVKSERPCETLASKIPCGGGYSFPSSHTIVAFTVMLAFLNKPSFPIYLTYAIFVAFTRIYLGMHSFEDVAGSAALAPFMYYITDRLWRKLEARKYAFRDELGHRD